MANSDTVNSGMHEGVSQASEAVGDMANNVKEKVSQFGRAAVQKVDESRTSTAEALQGSAGSLRTAGQSSGEAITNVANRTADKLESTAQYVRQHDFRGMMQDLEEMVRRNPTQTLIAALAIGFLAGAALRSRD